MIKKSILLVLLLTVLYGFYKADVSLLNDNKKESNLPELLQRSEKIQLGKEWDFTQNYYSDQSQRITKNQDDLEAHLNLAELFIKEARVTGEHGHYYPAALALTDKVLEAEAKSTKVERKNDLTFRALVTKAGIQLSLHEFAIALETANKALAINGYNAQLFGVLVDCNVELGNYKEAIVMADRMAGIKPDIRSYSRVSYLRELHGDIEGAIDAMTMAVKSGYPGYEETAWAMLTLGNLYKDYGDSESAKKVYESILEMRSDYPFAIAALGDLALDKKDYMTAELELKRAASIIPEVGYYTSLARLYKEQNRTEEFDAIIVEILAMLKDDVEAGHVMNLAYADLYKDLLDDPNTALEYAMKEYKKRPVNIEINRVLANIQLDKKNMAEAKKYFIAASITHSKHPELESISNRI